MKKCRGIGFKCWEWTKGRSVFVFATMLWSYLGTFLDSFNGSQWLRPIWKQKGSGRKRRSLRSHGVRKRNSELDLKLCFSLIQNLVAFSWVLFYCIGTLEKNTTAYRKPRFNHFGQKVVWQLQETWALQMDFSSSILHILRAHNNICLIYTTLNSLSYDY